MKRRSILQMAGAVLAAPLARLLPPAPRMKEPLSETAALADVARLQPYEPDDGVTHDPLTQTTQIRLLKYGRTLTVSDEAIRRQRIA